ncbi:MAG TPA: hypothetical protein VMU63_09440 [Acidimicrobiales bacterium]|nr:hypothetical protein [Acidimicrobiales bacterium]
MTAGAWRRILARHLAGDWPTGKVIDALFQSVLLRPADAPSRRYYVRALARGVPVGEVVRAIHTSAEAVDNSWRAPLAAGLGPALWARRAGTAGRGAGAPPTGGGGAQGTRRTEDDGPAQVYVACPPAAAGGDGSGVWAALAGIPTHGIPTRGSPTLVGYDLDQLVWVPALVRRRAAGVVGPLGAVGRRLVDPSAVSVLVVAPPAGAGASVQARVLASPLDPAGAWLDYSPVTEAARRGLEATRPLQALLEAGPEDAGPASLEKKALAAMACFDWVVLDGPRPRGHGEGTGPDWALYRAARAMAADRSG